jgi:hypothetical protein
MERGELVTLPKRHISWRAMKLDANIAGVPMCALQKPTWSAAWWTPVTKMVYMSTCQRLLSKDWHAVRCTPIFLEYIWVNSIIWPLFGVHLHVRQHFWSVHSCTSLPEKRRTNWQYSIIFGVPIPVRQKDGENWWSAFRLTQILIHQVVLSFQEILKQP